jgi:hypothetical protein
MRAITIFVAGLLLYVQAPVTYAFDLQAAAKEVSSGIGTTKVYQGNNGAPIFIFEESHDSYTMCLEESVGLVRLYKKFKLKDIGLEGFTDKDHPWTKDFTPNPDVALALLKKGEVNSAEFMALAYGVHVHPIERAPEYIVYNGNADGAISEYVIKLALQNFQKRLENGTLPPDIAKRVVELQKTDDTAGLGRLIVAFDTDLKNQTDRLKASTTSASDEIKILKTLVNRADNLHVDIASDSSQEMARYIQFLEARNAASDTMAKSIAALAVDNSIPVAMIIGSRHTPDVVAPLVAQNRPVVVVSPDAARFGEISFTPSQMSLLYDGLPLGQDDITATLKVLEKPKLAKVKPPSPFNSNWLQTKGEIYNKVDGLVRILVGAGGGGSGGGNNKPPPDWSTIPPDSPEFRNFVLAIPDEKFRGKQVSIDKTRIELVHSDNGTSFVFPMELGMPDGKKKEVWVRAGALKSWKLPDNDSYVEQEILDMLNHKDRPATEGTKVDEAKVDVVDLSKVTKMAMASTKETVMKVDPQKY